MTAALWWIDGYQLLHFLSSKVSAFFLPDKILQLYFLFCRYYEVKLLTDGMMRVGWATSSFPAGQLLGADEHSYAFDGFLVRTTYCLHSNKKLVSYMYSLYAYSGLPKTRILSEYSDF